FVKDRVGGPIFVGGIITTIALALNLGFYWHNMCLYKNKLDGKYLIMVNSRQ
ncbi:hypothetical protein RYX36_033723, partial [Vicia faba]